MFLVSQVGQYENYFRRQSILYQHDFDGSYFPSSGGKIPAGAQNSPGIFFLGLDDRAGQAASALVRFSVGGVARDPRSSKWMDPQRPDGRIFSDLGGGSSGDSHFFCGAVCDVGKNSQRGAADSEGSGYR